MKSLAGTLITLLFLFHESASLPITFYTFYDLARTGSATSAPDLVGSGPTMAGGSATNHGIALSSTGGWVSKLDRASLSIQSYSSNWVSAILAFSPNKCNPGQVLLAAVASPGNVSCGVVCSNSSSTAVSWRISCNASSGTEYSNDFVTVPGKATTLGLEFYYYSGDMKVRMNAYVQLEGSSSFSTYSFVSTKLNFSSLFPKSRLTFLPPVGALYYLGFLITALTPSVFSDYTSDTLTATKDIVCSNCAGAAADLTCANQTELMLVPWSLREYFCTCAGNYGFDLSVSGCAQVVYGDDCDLSCPSGCRATNRSVCKTYCPSDMYEIETDGEFVSCACVGSGETVNRVTKVCSSGSSQSQGTTAHQRTGFEVDPSWKVIVGVSVPLGIVVILIVVCVIRTCIRKCRAQQQPPQPDTNDKEHPHETKDKQRLNLDTLKMSTECKICYRPGVRLVAILPCGHAAVCEECVKRVQSCPFDRTRIEEWIVIGDELKRKIEAAGGVKKEEITIKVLDSSPANAAAGTNCDTETRCIGKVEERSCEVAGEASEGERNNMRV
ncbi:MAG: RING finger protein [Candidatus Pacebacteria bacterium]|nr:RING finger protein [Candidatus Paceibacterota bacterium]